MYLGIWQNFPEEGKALRKKKNSKAVEDLFEWNAGICNIINKTSWFVCQIRMNYYLPLDIGLYFTLRISFCRKGEIITAGTYISLLFILWFPLFLEFANSLQNKSIYIARMESILNQ